MLKSKGFIVIFIVAFILMSSIVSFGASISYTYTYDDFHRLKQIENHSNGTVTVYSYDEVGNRTRKIVTTLGSPPIAEFSATPISGSPPLTVNFIDQSVGNITSWSWTFGDSGMSTLQNPSHIYQDAGTFTVALTVSGLNGSDTLTKTAFINVTSPPACTYSIIPTTQVCGAAGCTGCVTLTSSSSSCAWTTTNNNPSWITITSGGSGTGNGSVCYSVSENTGTTSRAGTLNIAGQIFTITQAGEGCTYSIPTTSQSFNGTGGTGSVSVITGSGCNWTATSNNPDWIAITSGSNGSGNGTVNYSVSANTSTASRAGTMTIAGQIFTVNQSAPASSEISCPVLEDTMIYRDWNSACGDSMYANSETFWVATRPGINRFYRYLTKFDLSGIPSGSEITQATLRLYASYQSEYKDNTFYVNRVAENWDDTAATWCDRMPGYSWQNQGGTSVANGQASVLIPNKYGADWHLASGPYNEWIEWDITDIVKAWIQDGNPNYGVIVSQLDIPNSSENQQIAFYSNEYNDAQLRPQLKISITTEGRSIQLPQTGQTKCYDSVGSEIACTGTGQDGDIRAGVEWPEPRFTDNGDGTVTDKLTGLMWTKDANLAGWGYWQNALDYIAGMNAGIYPNFGYTDWRLPDINEMVSLIDYGKHLPDLPDGHPFVNIEGAYWTSTTCVQRWPGSAWFVVIGGGGSGTGTYAKGDSGANAWPVRSGQGGIIQLPKTNQTKCYAGDSSGAEIPCSGSGQDGELQKGIFWPSPRFTDNGDGTMTDNLTGLVWLKDANCIATKYPSFDNDSIPGDGGVIWQHGLEFVVGINSGTYPDCSAGHTDWRLPNINELHSLINHYDQTDIALWLSTQGFSNVNAYLFFYWSSTTLAWDTGQAWHFINGGSTYSYKTSPYYVWPVRGGSLINPDILVAPASYDFGNITSGSSSNPQTFTISNTGTGDLQIGTITITGTNANQFRKQSDNCSGQTVVPSSSCTVDAVFSPTSAGAKSANLSIPSNAPGSPALVPLSGTVILPAVTCSFTPVGTTLIRGGTLRFWASAQNNEGTTQNFKFATKVKLPNGNMYPSSGWLFGPISVTLGPHTSKSKSLTQFIPYNAPYGTYTYHGYVGKVGVGLYNQCQFTFKVVQ